MKAVIDSGPLIALGKLNLLPLMKKVFDEVFIPVSVYKEVVLKGLKKGAPDARTVLSFIEEEKSFVSIIYPKGKLRPLQVGLSEGEQDAIELAKEFEVDFVLIDEVNTRNEARNVGIKVKGTLGLLVQAYKNGAISFGELKYFFNQIKSRHDIWISKELCDEVLKVVRKNR